MGESWSAHLGEEVEKVAPDAVTRDADGGIRIVNQKLYRETALKIRMDAQAERAEEQAQAERADPINQTIEALLDDQEQGGDQHAQLSGQLDELQKPPPELRLRTEEEIEALLADEQ